MKEDFNALRLKHHGDPIKMDEILQHECRYKCSSKLPNTLKCESFRFPSLALAEMSTSDAVAEIHASLIDSEEKVLDMTCGLGIDTFHIARRASEVTSIELDTHACQVARENVKALGLDNVDIFFGDSIEWLKGNDQTFDTIFVDPARRDASGRHFAFADCAPDVAANIRLLTDRCRRLIIKASPMIDITAACRELGCVSKVLIIGTQKECKETVFICNGSDKLTNNANGKNPLRFKCITIGRTDFEFDADEENKAERVNSGETPSEGMWLYEPHPAVMKSRAFNLITARFGIGRLNENTNLYLSTTIINGFPGEAFKIESVLPFNKQTVRNFTQNHPKINVATRNFPLSAPQLAKKLKITEGGDKMVFGVTAESDIRLLIITGMGK